MLGEREARPLEAAFTAALAVPRPLPQLEVERLADEVLDMDPARRLMLVRNRPHDLGRPEICWEIIVRSDARRHTDPRGMRVLAEVAVEVALALPAEGRLGALVTDLRAEALATLANALRVEGKLEEAEEIWPRVRLLAGRGSGDPLLAAKIYRYLGSLRKAQRRLFASLLQLHRARRQYLLAGDRHEAGRVMLLIAQVYREKGAFQRAIDLTELGGSLLEAGRDPDLHLAVAHNLACLLAETGAIGVLGEQLANEHRSAGFEFDNPAHIRMRWLEATILARAGKGVEARRALRAVCDAFLDLELEFDAALAALDLAALLAESGNHWEVERLTEEMYLVFISRKIPREAAATLLLFIDAVNQRQASAERIRELQSELQALRN